MSRYLVLTAAESVHPHEAPAGRAALEYDSDIDQVTVVQQGLEIDMGQAAILKADVRGFRDDLEAHRRLKAKACYRCLPKVCYVFRG
jgi:hypothetical protein